MVGTGQNVEMSTVEVRSTLELISANADELASLAQAGHLPYRSVEVAPSPTGTTVTVEDVDNYERHSWDENGLYKNGTGYWSEGGPMQGPEHSGSSSVTRSDGEQVLRVLRGILE